MTTNAYCYLAGKAILSRGHQSPDRISMIQKKLTGDDAIIDTRILIRSEDSGVRGRIPDKRGVPLGTQPSDFIH